MNTMSKPRWHGDPENVDHREVLATTEKTQFDAPVIYIYGKVSKLGCVTRVITTTHQTIPSEQVTFGGNKLFGNTTAVSCTFLADIVANTIEQKQVDTVIMSTRTCKRPPYSDVGPTVRYHEQVEITLRCYHTYMFDQLSGIMNKLKCKMLSCRDTGEQSVVLKIDQHSVRVW